MRFYYTREPGDEGDLTLRSPPARRHPRERDGREKEEVVGGAGLVHKGNMAGFWRVGKGRICAPISAIPTVLLNVGKLPFLHKGVAGLRAQVRVMSFDRASSPKQPSDAVGRGYQNSLATPTLAAVLRPMAYDTPAVTARGVSDH